MNLTAGKNMAYEEDLTSCRGLDISVQQFSSVLFRILKSAQYGKDIRSLKSEFL
jgi:hypothetical protein